jgi:hypothetical protein
MDDNDTGKIIDNLVEANKALQKWSIHRNRDIADAEAHIETIIGILSERLLKDGETKDAFVAKYRAAWKVKRENIRTGRGEL